ncbi:uncharacterized protein LOC142493778 [Ascaphus truei]|uniref:uncharacterized protein LOC142493778 n=1 Tax=Ascaphus truei TaxID=8439 RepID=UPI003F59F427
MGSGSSKGSRRALRVSSGQHLLNPTELSSSDNPGEGRVPCKQETEGELQGAGRNTGDNLPTREIRGGRLAPMDIDQDLQLLDEALAESEDCLSWQRSTYKGQIVSCRSQTVSTISSPGLLLQVAGEQKHSTETDRTTQKPAELQTSSSVCNNIPYRPDTMSENCNKMSLITRSTQDNENNNRPYQCQSRHSQTDEAPDPITYDDSEEALMDSIEREYSQ